MEHQKEEIIIKASALELFSNGSIMEQILQCTYAYAKSKKESMKGRYKLFMKKQVGKLHQFTFVGVLILLEIHGVQNHRKAWNTASSLPFMRPTDLPAL